MVQFLFLLAILVLSGYLLLRHLGRSNQPGRPAPPNNTPGNGHHHLDGPAKAPAPNTNTHQEVDLGTIDFPLEELPVGHSLPRGGPPPRPIPIPQGAKPQIQIEDHRDPFTLTDTATPLNASSLAAISRVALARNCHQSEDQSWHDVQEREELRQIHGPQEVQRLLQKLLGMAEQAAVRGETGIMYDFEQPAYLGPEATTIHPDFRWNWTLFDDNSGKQPGRLGQSLIDQLRERGFHVEFRPSRCTTYRISQYTCHPRLLIRWGLS